MCNVICCGPWFCWTSRRQKAFADCTPSSSHLETYVQLSITQLSPYCKYKYRCCLHVLVRSFAESVEVKPYLSCLTSISSTQVCLPHIMEVRALYRFEKAEAVNKIWRAAPKRNELAMMGHAIWTPATRWTQCVIWSAFRRCLTA